MNIKKLSFLLIMAALLPAACSSQVPETEPVPAPVPEVLPTPETLTPLEDRLLAAIEVGFPDEMVFVQGLLWVKTDDGRVVYIDPATNSVAGEIKVDNVTNFHDYCQGLGTDGLNVWACATRGDENARTIDVVRIDPATQSVVATVDVNKLFDQFQMPFLDGHIWVLTGDGSKLVGIDTISNQAGPAIDLGVRCFQAAAAGDDLLVTCKLDKLLLRVDPETMQVTDRRTFEPAPWNLRAADHGVWLGLGNSLLRLDPETLDTVAVFAGMPGDKDLFVTEDAVWVRTDYGFLFKIDPATNRVVEQVESNQRRYNMGGFLVTEDSVWTSAGDDDLVLRIGLK